MMILSIILRISMSKGSSIKECCFVFIKQFSTHMSAKEVIMWQINPLKMLASYMSCQYLAVHFSNCYLFSRAYIEIFNSDWDGNGKS